MIYSEGWNQSGAIDVSETKCLKILDRRRDRMFLFIIIILTFAIKLFRSVLGNYSRFPMIQLWQTNWKGDTTTIHLPVEWVSSMLLVYGKDDLDFFYFLITAAIQARWE